MVSLHEHVSQMGPLFCQSYYTSPVQPLYLPVWFYCLLYIHLLPHFYKPLSQMINLIFFIENNGCSKSDLIFPSLNSSAFELLDPTYSVYPPGTYPPLYSQWLPNGPTYLRIAQVMYSALHRDFTSWMHPISFTFTMGNMELLIPLPLFQN